MQLHLWVVLHRSIQVAHDHVEGEGVVVEVCNAKVQRVAQLVEGQVGIEVHVDEVETPLLAFSMKAKHSTWDHLYEKGDDTDRAYLVLSGSLTLTTKGNDEEKTVVQRFTEGDFFGSLSLFGSMPALFNLTTETKTTVLTIDRKQFSKILVQFPEIQTLSMRAVLKEIHRWERTNISEAAPSCSTRMGITAL